MRGISWELRRDFFSRWLAAAVPCLNAVFPLFTVSSPTVKSFSNGRYVWNAVHVKSNLEFPKPPASLCSLSIPAVLFPESRYQHFRVAFFCSVNEDCKSAGTTENHLSDCQTLVHLDGLAAKNELGKDEDSSSESYEILAVCSPDATILEFQAAELTTVAGSLQHSEWSSTTDQLITCEKNIEDVASGETGVFDSQEISATVFHEQEFSPHSESQTFDVNCREQEFLTNFGSTDRELSRTEVKPGALGWKPLSSGDLSKGNSSEQLPMTEERANKTRKNGGGKESHLYSHILSIKEVRDVLENVRGKDVEVVYVGESCEWTDYMVFASGRSSRHLLGMADALIYKMKHSNNLSQNDYPVVEGRDGEQWMVVDCGNIIAHLFLEETRSNYGLEEFWRTKALSVYLDP